MVKERSLNPSNVGNKEVYSTYGELERKERPKRYYVYNQRIISGYLENLQKSEKK